MPRNTEQQRMDFLFRSLNSERSADEIYQELDGGNEKAQQDKKVKSLKAKPPLPHERVTSHNIEVPILQPTVALDSARGSMLYFCDPVGRRLMVFKTPGDRENTYSRRAVLLNLLSGTIEPWRVTTKDRWKTFRQSGFHQANSRTILAELVQSELDPTNLNRED